MGVNAYAYHMNASIIGTDADKFNPLRWRSSDASIMDTDLFRFSSACPGRHIALVAISKCIPTFLRKLKVELVNGMGYEECLAREADGN